MALKWHDVGFNIALTLFGVALVIYGVVIFRSRFLPRLIGVLYGIAGLCYLANSFVYFMAPSLSSPAILAPCLLGEGALALWMLIVGVNETRWRAVAERP